MKKPIKPIKVPKDDGHRPVHGPYREHRDSMRVRCGGGFRVVRKVMSK